MVLFISDIHFGRGDRAEERLLEDDLIRCLRAHEAEVEALYLVGDVFDQFIEYRHLVPKGFVRFQALLAGWTDRGVRVTYLTGNHDPWHRSYFEEELGVRVVFDAVTETLCGLRVYLAHGDGRAASQRLYNRLRPVLRHPLPVALYTLLPGDVGYGLARRVRRRLGDEATDEALVGELRLHARQLLADGADLVVMGHSHRAELTRWPEGHYLNPGFWRLERTYGRLDASGPALLRWNSTEG